MRPRSQLPHVSQGFSPHSFWGQRNVIRRSEDGQQEHGVLFSYYLHSVVIQFYQWLLPFTSNAPSRKPVSHVPALTSSFDTISSSLAPSTWGHNTFVVCLQMPQDATFSPHFPCYISFYLNFCSSLSFYFLISPLRRYIFHQTWNLFAVLFPEPRAEPDM